MANLQVVKAKVAAADAQQGTGGLLTKKVEVASRVMLSKRVSPNQQWQFILVVDRSGSMEYEYRNGSVQDAVNRALGFAVLVDDDGDVPTIFFDSRLEETVVTLDDFHDYVSRNGISARGSTDLTKALEHVAKITDNGDLLSASGGGFLKRSSASAPTVRSMQTPAFVTIITDGRPNDPNSAKDLIRKLSYRAIFLKFLYVGTDRQGWQFLEELDDDIPVGVSYDRGGRLIDNVDAKQLGLLGNTDDSTFYDAMLDEVSTYLEAARRNGLIA